MEHISLTPGVGRGVVIDQAFLTFETWDDMSGTEVNTTNITHLTLESLDFRIEAF